MMNTLREAREKAGLSQKELADRTGVKQPIISDIENGKVIAVPATKQKLEAELGHVDFLAHERILISGSYAQAQKLVRALRGVYEGMDVVEKRALKTLLWKHFRTSNK